MNRIRPLFLVCLFFLQGLFAFNSYANGLPVFDLLAFPEDGCFDVKEDGQCNWIYIGEAVYVEERKAGTKNGQGTYTFADGRNYFGEWKDGNPWWGIEYDKDGNETAIYVEGIRTE
jgi:hypothetical protein